MQHLGEWDSHLEERKTKLPTLDPGVDWELGYRIRQEKPRSACPLPKGSMGEMNTRDERILAQINISIFQNLDHRTSRSNVNPKSRLGSLFKAGHVEDPDWKAINASSSTQSYIRHVLWQRYPIPLPFRSDDMVQSSWYRRSHCFTSSRKHFTILSRRESTTLLASEHFQNLHWFLSFTFLISLEES